MMRIVVFIVAAILISGQPVPEAAAAPAGTYRGLGIFTSFPSQTVRAGEPVTLPVTVHNYGLAPQVVGLGVAQSSPGWKVGFVGGGRPISAVSVATDQEVTLTVRLDPPARARPATYRFTLVARGQGATAQLPLSLTIGQVQPPRLVLSAELPILRGAASNFKYRVTLKNESDQDLLVNLEGQSPKGFQVTFTPAFGSQQVTSLPIKAGESKDMDVDVNPPQDTAAGTYNITVRASSSGARAQLKLTAEVTGRADVQLTTPDGRLSSRAYAGRETPIKLVVKNNGSAPARNIEVSSFEPTGWSVTFDPKRIDEIAAKGQAEVTARVVPSSKAIAGDYMLNMRASAGDASATADFRITVYTSALWGAYGLLLIAAALGVLALVVSRYGRR